MEFTNFTTLENVEVSHNRISGAIPSEIGTMKALQKFEITANEVKGTIPTELGSLSN